MQHRGSPVRYSPPVKASDVCLHCGERCMNEVSVIVDGVADVMCKGCVVKLKASRMYDVCDSMLVGLRDFSDPYGELKKRFDSIECDWDISTLRSLEDLARDIIEKRIEVANAIELVEK